jgi:3-oxoacyl-[acyl-carrier-protein] synthase II
MNRRPPVITGMGAVTAIGESVPAFWAGLAAGRCGARPIRGFDTRAYRATTAYELATPGVALDGDGRGRTAGLLLQAVGEALADAALAAGGHGPSRVGVVVGSALTELRAAEAMAEGDVHPGYLRHLSLAGEIARRIGARGPQHTLANACAAGSYAVAVGADLLAAGEADCVVVAAGDTITESMFGQADRVNPHVPTCIAPFSEGRDGVLLGEGAAVLVLEHAEAAARRRVPVQGVIAGYAMGCDARKITAMDLDRVAGVMAAALADAGIAADEIDYVSAHGTGTPMNDRVEAEAIDRVLGARARAIPVSAIKSMIGHTSGGAGALALVSTLLAMRHGLVPPTVNLERQDPAIPFNCVPNRAQAGTVRTALVNAFGFGGTDCCLVVRAPVEAAA